MADAWRLRPADEESARGLSADLSVRSLTARSAQAFRARFVGRSLPVLWEAAARLGPEGWIVRGLTDNYLRVQAVAQQDLWNHLSQVEIREIQNGELHGRILPDPPQ